jgi:hypothetical protein
LPHRLYFDRRQDAAGVVARLEEIIVVASDSEAIQSGAPKPDCFVASLLAMTKNYSAAT